MHAIWWHAHLPAVQVGTRCFELSCTSVLVSCPQCPWMAYRASPLQLHDHRGELWRLQVFNWNTCQSLNTSGHSLANHLLHSSTLTFTNTQSHACAQLAVAEPNPILPKHKPPHVKHTCQAGKLLSAAHHSRWLQSACA